MIAPILKTPRLVLRPLKAEDAAEHFKHINDWEVTRYLGAAFPWPYPEGGSEKYIESRSTPGQTSLVWAITMPEKYGDNLLGVIELRPQEEEGQRGFWMGRAYHNQGIMTEAVYATNDYWFDTLGRETLHLINAVANPASAKIKTKSGALHLGTRPGKFLDPSFTEEDTWLLTRDAWHDFRGKHPLPSARKERLAKPPATP